MRNLYSHVRWIMTHCSYVSGEGSSWEACKAMWDEFWLAVPLFQVKAAHEKLVRPCEMNFDSLSLCFRWRQLMRSLYDHVRWILTRCPFVSGEGSSWEACTTMWDEFWLAVPLFQVKAAREKLVRPCEMNFDSLSLCFRWRQLMRSLYDHVRWILTRCPFVSGEGSSWEACTTMWDEFWLAVPLFQVKAAHEKLVRPCEINFDSLFLCFRLRQLVRSLYGHVRWIMTHSFVFQVKAAREKLERPREINNDSLFVRSLYGHVRWIMTHYFCVSGEGSSWETRTTMWHVQ